MGYSRVPIDDTAFAEVAQHFDYDPDLPLHNRVIRTETHDGRELPYSTDKVEFGSIQGQRVIGYFAYPRTEDGPFPAVILLHGYNGFRGSQDSWSRSWLDTLARQGYCVLAIDQFGYGERLLPDDRAMLFFGNIGPRQKLDLVRQHIVDVRRSIDFLQDRPEVDDSRIVLMGASMGGYNACLAAGVDHRPCGAALVITGAWPPDIGTDDPHGRYGHTLNFAPRIRAACLLVYSLHDGRELGEELFAFLPEPKQASWVDSDDHVILFEDHRDDVLHWLGEHGATPG